MNKSYLTERLILRTLDGRAAPAMLDYFLRNKAFLEEYEPQRDTDFYTLKYQQRQLEREQAAMECGAMLRLWIFVKSKPDVVIGSVSFSNILRGSFHSCFVGYRLDEQEINNGYMTEALTKGIEVIFGEYRLHRIEANIMPRNKRSLRVVEKLGFRWEGLAREYLMINGKWEDHVRTVLINSSL